MTVLLEALSPSTRPRPLLRWHGGKWMLAPWIIENMPAHRIYVEPYCGAASVLLRKPRAYSEVINDLDGEVVNLFRVLRDRTDAKELQRLLRLTPFARTEFEESYTASLDPVEQARRTVVRSFMGFGSNAHNQPTGFRANSNRSGTTPAHDWANYPDGMDRLTARLQGVVIEARPAQAILRQHDAPDALHYVDPPYVHETRATGQQTNYRHEMTDDDHRSLAVTLHGLSGMVMLSGYPCDLYDRELYQDWQRLTRAHHGDGACDRTECLWFNPAATLRAKQCAMVLL